MKILYFLKILLLIFFTNANSSELLKLQKPNLSIKCYIEYGPMDKFDYYYDFYQDFVIEKRQQNTNSKYFKEYTYNITNKKDNKIFGELKNEYVEGRFSYVSIDFKKSKMTGGSFNRLLNNKKIFYPAYYGPCLSLN